MSVLEVFTYVFEGDTKRLDQSVKSADKSVDGLTHSLNKADLAAGSLAEGFVGLVKGAGAALLAYASVGAIATMVSNVVNATDALGDQAQALGVNVSALDAWDAAAARSGGQAGAFATSLATFNERAQETARKGSAELVAMFEKAGLSLQELKANIADPIALLTELSGTFEKMSAAEAAGLGKKLGLDPGTINLLRQGNAGLAEAIRQQEELGVVTAEQTEAAGKYNDALDDAKRVWDDVRRQLVMTVLPAITWVGEKFGQLGKLVRENSTFVAFGVGIIAAAVAGLLLPALLSAATAAWALIAPFLPIIAIVALVGAALALVADDIYNFLQGNDSMIGEISKKWPAVGETIKAVAAAVQMVIAFAGEMGDILSTLFSDGPEAAFAHAIRVIRQLGPAFKDQYPQFAQVFDYVSMALANASAAFFGLLTVTKNVFAILTGDVEGVSQSFGLISDALRVLAASFEQLWTFVSGVFNAIVVLIQEGPTAAIRVLGDTAGEMLAKFAVALPGIAAFWKGMGETAMDVVDGIGSAWQWLIGIIQSAMGLASKAAGVVTGAARMLGLGSGGDATGAAQMGAAQLGAAGQSSVGATSAAAVTAGATNNRSTSVRVDSVTVNTQATDAEGVASAVGNSLSNELRSAADASDDGVAA